MRLHVILVGALVLSAGCSGFIGDDPTATTVSEGQPSETITPTQTEPSRANGSLCTNGEISDEVALGELMTSPTGFERINGPTGSSTGLDRSFLNLSEATDSTVQWYNGPDGEQYLLAISEWSGEIPSNFIATEAVSGGKYRVSVLSRNGNGNETFQEDLVTSVRCISADDIRENQLAPNVAGSISIDSIATNISQTTISTDLTLRITGSVENTDVTVDVIDDDSEEKVATAIVEEKEFDNGTAVVKFYLPDLEPGAYTIQATPRNFYGTDDYEYNETVRIE